MPLHAYYCAYQPTKPRIVCEPLIPTEKFEWLEGYSKNTKFYYSLLNNPFNVSSLNRDSMKTDGLEVKGNKFKLKLKMGFNAVAFTNEKNEILSIYNRHYISYCIMHT